MQKTIVVTGANRGIGYEISKELAEMSNHVILAARNQESGEEAADKLKDQGHSCEFRLLDLEDSQSIHDFAKGLYRDYDHLDVLINNAGVFIDKDVPSTKVDMDIIRKTMDINCFGAVDLSKTLLNLLKGSDDPRIINMTSDLGAMNEMAGRHTAYRLSKAALNAFTQIYASDLSDTKIKVNSMCPGWVKTEMGGSGAARSLEQGADTAVWLATSNEVKTGKFYRDREEIDW